MSCVNVNRLFDNLSYNLESSVFSQFAACGKELEEAYNLIFTNAESSKEKRIVGLFLLPKSDRYESVQQETRRRRCQIVNYNCNKARC